jgi:RNA polymerase sigma factor for flagellar operon FliA
MTASPRTAYEKAGDQEQRIRSLVLEHLPLARGIVGRMSVSLGPTVSWDDLCSAATLGLVEAAHRYDESRGTKFETFAYPRVRGAVMDCLRGSDWLGKSARERLGALREHMRELRAHHGRKPTIEELASKAGMSDEDVLKYLSYEKWDSVASLQDCASEGGNDGASLETLIAADIATPLEELEWAEKVELLVRAIHALPEREKQIIIMYYYEDLYMSEMAEVLQVSESRVSQLHTRAIYNLSRMLESYND